MGTMRSNLAKVATDAIRQARQEEMYQTELQGAFGGFDTWCKDNQVPQDLVNDAVREYQSRWGNTGKPKAVVEWLSDYIVKRSNIDRDNQTVTQKASEAAQKAKDLAAAEQPIPGTPISPEAQTEKTPQQKEADNIAPDQEYVFPG